MAVIRPHGGLIRGRPPGPLVLALLTRLSDRFDRAGSGRPTARADGLVMEGT